MRITLHIMVFLARLGLADTYICSIPIKPDRVGLGLVVGANGGDVRQAVGLENIYFLLRNNGHVFSPFHYGTQVVIKSSEQRMSRSFYCSNLPMNHICCTIRLSICYHACVEAVQPRKD